MKVEILVSVGPEDVVEPCESKAEQKVRSGATVASGAGENHLPESLDEELPADGAEGKSPFTSKVASRRDGNNCDVESFLSGSSDEEDCPGRELPRARANGSGVPPAALETGDRKLGSRKFRLAVFNMGPWAPQELTARRISGRHLAVLQGLQSLGEELPGLPLDEVLPPSISLHHVREFPDVFLRGTVSFMKITPRTVIRRLAGHQQAPASTPPPVVGDLQFADEVL
ncbi:Neuronal Growth Regulator 1 [Manis pentadactyla]|nr:Neuronal Growth Regulator 1 [Manis pentadactyla]